MAFSFSPGSYRQILKAEFEKRSKKNARYSLRAFARQIDLAPSRVSEILRGKQGLSVAVGKKIAERLGFPPTDTRKFCDLVEIESSRSPIRRKLAKLRLEVFEMTESQKLAEEAFRVIADWNHLAIVELLGMPEFHSRLKPGFEISILAKRLEIHPQVAREAVQRLEAVGLIFRPAEGYFKPTEVYSSVSSERVPSEAIRNFQAQVLQKALSAVQAQPFESRDHSAMLLPFDPRKMDEARAAIKKFRLGFAGKVASEGQRDSLYCLSVQFFRADIRPETGMNEVGLGLDKDGSGLVNPMTSTQVEN